MTKLTQRRRLHHRNPADSHELPNLELSGAWEPTDSSGAPTQYPGEISHSGFSYGNQVEEC